MATTTLRVGTLVLNQALRHPATLAKEAATIDLLSRGRLELGLGAGYVEAEQHQAGIEFEPAAVRVERFKEYVHVVKGLLEHESLHFNGHYYHIDGLPGLPRPVQRPRPSILIGGSQRQLLSYAAREADIVALWGGVKNDFALLEQQIGWIRAAAGSRLDELQINIIVYGPQTIGVGRREATAAALAELRGGPIAFLAPASEEALLASPYFLFGTVDEAVEALQQLRGQYGISHVTYLPTGPVRGLHGSVRASGCTFEWDLTRSSDWHTLESSVSHTSSTGPARRAANADRIAEQFGNAALIWSPIQLLAVSCCYRTIPRKNACCCAPRLLGRRAGSIPPA